MSLTGTFLRLKAGIGAQNALYAWVRGWMAARRMIAPAFIHGRVEIGRNAIRNFTDSAPLMSQG